MGCAEVQQDTRTTNPSAIDALVPVRAVAASESRWYAGSVVWRTSGNRVKLNA
jgi:hypothetical protein